MTYTANDLLAEVAEGLQFCLQKVEAWQELPVEALDRKPAPEKWSPNECLGHIIIANEHYIREIEKLKEKGKFRGGQASARYASGWLGGWLRKTMAPQQKPGKGGMKTLAIFDPAKKGKAPSSGSEAAKAFIAQTRRLLRLVDDCRQADINRLRVPTEIVSFVTLKVGDALLFMDAHTRRHVLQAEKALETGG